MGFPWFGEETWSVQAFHFEKAGFPLQAVVLTLFFKPPFPTQRQEDENKECEKNSHEMPAHLIRPYDKPLTMLEALDENRQS